MFVSRSKTLCLAASLTFSSVSLAAPPKIAPKKAALKKAAPVDKVSPFRLIVPAMGLDIPVSHGTDDAALRRAPGFDPLSALPGERGNCVVASHRNVHGAYFWYLTEVKPGALITLQTPQKSFVYRVTAARLVAESQTEILENDLSVSAAPRLTLYTCTLPVSPKRLVVSADLVSSGAPLPKSYYRPASVREITSGPLKLLKDPTLKRRYRSLLRYANEKQAEKPPIGSESALKP